ncbi:hypothetical protein BKP35_16545 [Anaerobacillus arseniciselenatis]|uniref:HTH cro/C1-type domain-containing protein n=1 Tax=Anaerobacillus arseniciselenatis TaxID=85682 RepID=A0A1S2LBQ4_9BACI|nr:hypothetical protein BKP35_16545 [Anaerobacillus arseniciselenatis]
MLLWNLDNYMKKNNLSSQDVISKTGIHPNIISRIKRNKQRRIDLDVLERLLLGLNCSPNDLLRIEFKSEG